MDKWTNPPDMHYSFKTHFNWPTPPPAGAAAEAAATVLPHGPTTGGGGYGGGPYGRGHHPFGHSHGYGRGYFRPRFGLFRRMVWFGLGVGAASWYIHRNDPATGPGRCISNRASSPPASPTGGQKPEVPTWRAHWQSPHPSDSIKVPASISVDHKSKTVPEVLVSTPVLGTEQERRPWGWGARREERRRRREEAATTGPQPQGTEVGDEKEEIKRIKEAIEKIWAERKHAAVEIQAQANVKAKEYARVKLETLSQAVDTLRDALKADAEKADREPKLV